MKRGVRPAALGIAVAMVLAACSVTTPRDGSVAGPVGRSTSPGTEADAVSDAAASAGPGVVAADAADSESSAVVRPGTETTATRNDLGGRTPSVTTAPTGKSATGSTVGLTRDSIVISVLAGYSGTYGSLFRAFANDGYGLWADEVNDHGGINGRKVVLKLVDNHDTVEGGVAACKEVQGNGSFAAISMAGLAGADMSSANCLDRAGIPVFAFNLAGFTKGWRYIISPMDAAKQAAPVASFLRNVLGERGNVGMIVVNDPIYSAGAGGVKAELTRLGMNLVRSETISIGQGAFVAELSRLRDAGATSVVLMTGNEAIGIIRDARAMGYSPTWTGAFFTIDEFSRAAGTLWDGIKAIRLSSTTDSPAYATYAAAAKKYGHDALASGTLMLVYGAGLMVGDMLKLAGPSLTRDDVAPAAERIVNYDNGILAVSFGPGVRVAEIAMFPTVCCKPDRTWQAMGAPRYRF